MNQEPDNRDEGTHRPKGTYPIISLIFSIGYPVWAVYVLWNGIEEWPTAGEPMGTTTLLLFGGFLWVLSLLALWIMYDGVNNGLPHSREEGS